MFQEEIISAEGGKGKALSAERSKTKEQVIFPIEVLNDSSSRTEETHFNARMIKLVKWMVDSEAANYMTNERDFLENQEQLVVLIFALDSMRSSNLSIKCGFQIFTGKLDITIKDICMFLCL